MTGKHTHVAQPSPDRHHLHQLAHLHHQRDDFTKSSDYINLTEPPEASKTPEPQITHPSHLIRRKSSNYQTALLENKFNDYTLHEKDHPDTTPAVRSNPERQSGVIEFSEDSIKYPNYIYNTNSQDSGSDVFTKSNVASKEHNWSTENAKRHLQRRSTNLGSERYHDDKTFNIVYTPQETNSNPLRDTSNEKTSLESSKTHKKTHGGRISYHSNQDGSDSVIVDPTDETSDKPDISKQRSSSFHYDDFKRRMQYE